MSLPIEAETDLFPNEKFSEIERESLKHKIGCGHLVARQIWPLDGTDLVKSDPPGPFEGV